MPDSTAPVRYSPRPGHLRAVPTGPSGGEAQPRSLLIQAGEDVRGTWDELLRESFDSSEISDVVAWIVRSTEHAAREQDFAPPDGPIALTRFLLERVGSAVLERASTDPQVGKAECLQLLRGVSTVRQMVEPEWDRYFSSQISGPDGLNLVIEVAHDLRSPLTSIRCLAETIERGQSGPVTDLQRKQLRLIYSASLGLGSMATDVIEMARRGDQLTEGDAVPFSLSEVLGNVADMVRPIAEEKGVAFAFQTLPTDQRVGLPFQLSRILLNLVTNALKFTDEGGVEIHVKATGMTRVEFAVVDTGHGIPDEAIPALFRPFRRSSARSGRSGYLFSGTGLGLALCRKLLRVMDSDLKFETRVGEGTRFFFELELPPTTRL